METLRDILETFAIWTLFLGVFSLISIVIMVLLQYFNWWKYAGNWSFIPILTLLLTFLLFFCLISEVQDHGRINRNLILIAIILICALTLSTVRVNKISKGKEVAVVEYEMNIENQCLKAIDSWRQSGTEIGQYRTTNDIRKFFSNEHKLEGRDELNLVASNGRYKVVENLEAVAYIVSTYQVVGTYSGGATGAGGAPAAVITWEVSIVDLRHQVVTAQAVFVGPFPSEHVDALRTHWENGTVIGTPPINDLERWIASLPISLSLLLSPLSDN